jgi:lipopolysaccharide transport system ATP-binding protein
MNDLPAISYEDVSKKFVFSSEKSQTLLQSLQARLSRQGKEQERTLWAVKNVSFDVMTGDCVGLIGRNGSGKSTLLKLTAGIIRPTSGQITLRGRVSALLELGAGFHLDLTGSENIYLNASIMGLNREETNASYDDIVAFSELEEFIDVPVKHYSSGMYMRLGFSVAVHVEPKILLVDEVLAVGDQAFREKCFERIVDLMKGGTTILFVSHDMNTMRSLCSHLVWMEHGEVRSVGPSDEVIGDYLEYSHKRAHGQAKYIINKQDIGRRWGTGEIEVTAVRFLDAAGEEQQLFKTGDAITIEMAYVAHKSVPDPEFGLNIYRSDGIQVNGPNNRLAGLTIKGDKGQGVVRYNIERLPLLPALYTVSVAVHNDQATQAYDFHFGTYQLRVVAGGTPETAGMVEFPANWEWEFQPETQTPQPAEPLTEPQ